MDSNEAIDETPMLLFTPTAAEPERRQCKKGDASNGATFSGFL